MSVHYEGAESATTSVGWSGPLQLIGDDQLGVGQYALVLDYGEIFYIEGTPEHLRRFANLIITEVEEIEQHAAGPLTLDDIEYDADYPGYVCNRCGEAFEIADHATLGSLDRAIVDHVKGHNEGVKE